MTLFCNLDDSSRLSMMRELWSRFTFGTGTLHVEQLKGLPQYCAVLSHVWPGSHPKPEGDSDYTLQVTDQGFALAASDAAGFAHAFFTVLQLFRPTSLTEGQVRFTAQHVTIKDRPVLGFRGIHLCVFPETSLLLLEKAIKLAGFLKFSHVVFEFWGTLRFDVMPELAWKDRAYSKDQMRPLIETARAMGMQVIPMFNHLGHATQSRVAFGRHVVLDQNPKHALLFEPDGWTWCVSNPAVHELLRAVRLELIELCGAGDYFHLGCDEAYSYLTCDVCRQRDGAEVFADYINGIASELALQGRRAIIWGDELLSRSEWPRPVIANGTELPEVLPQLDRSIVIADWQYDIKSPEESVRTPGHFMKHGFDTLLCPWSDWENIKALGKGARTLSAMGVLATTWHHLPQYIPLLPATANVLWSGKAERPQRTETAALLRKLVPAPAYEDAGWNRREVEY